MFTLVYVVSVFGGVPLNVQSFTLVFCYTHTFTQLYPHSPHLFPFVCYTHYLSTPHTHTRLVGPHLRHTTHPFPTHGAAPAPHLVLILHLYVIVKLVCCLQLLDVVGVDGSSFRCFRFFHIFLVLLWTISCLACFALFWLRSG